MTKQRALVLGCGQDGAYLTEILLERGCEVHVMARRSSVDNLWRIRHLLDRVTVHRGDMADPLSVHRVIAQVYPDALFNEADQDDVNWSQSIPSYSFDITAAAVGRLLESVRTINPSCRVFQPCSAMMFGMAPAPQNEQTPFDPRSPYAVAKTAAFYYCQMYRKVHGMFVSTAILMNHDSPTRSEDYVLHKICAAAVRIARGEQKELVLGSLDVKLDIGYARDYMEAAYQILQLDEPDDFVIGTGEAWSIGQMANAAFAAAGVHGDWSRYIRIDPSFHRAGTQATLVADRTKAVKAFGFQPKHTIRDLIRMLVEHEQNKQAGARTAL